MSGFAGRRALVTGAASGIGLAVAAALGEQGARLVLVDSDAEGLARAGELPALSDAVCRAGDVRDEAFWAALAPDLEGLGLAVVNAGVSGAGTITEMTLEEWRRIVSINLDGAFLTLRAAMRAMAGRGGAIAMTASASGIKAEPGVAAYGASKAGLMQLAKVAAKEGAGQGIRVNAIAPGGVETPIWRDVPFFRELVREKGGEAAAFDAIAAIATPLGRYARADEIAAQILFLLSDAAATITGAILTSDGGYTL